MNGGEWGGFGAWLSCGKGARETMVEAAVALVLHAHLPWVRHAEHDDFLEERWLFEAVLESYLPLIGVFRRLAREGVSAKVSLSLSPSLMAMLRDGLLRRRFERHVEKVARVIEASRRDRRFSVGFERALDAHEERVVEARELWRALGGDVTAGFVEASREAGVELFTTALTHAWLPGLRNDKGVMCAQVRAGLREFRRETGCEPRGFWLPECGWVEEIDEVLAGEGIRWTVLEAHGVLHGEPRPRWGLARAMVTRTGVVVMGRDPEAGRAVWSREEGYPGEESYRDFYGDVGWVLDRSELGEFLVGEERQATGVKLWRNGKNPRGKRDGAWEPARAEEVVEGHAREFVRGREAWARWVTERGCSGAVAVCPYDAELFGHWWYEGVKFVERVLREAEGSEVIEMLGVSECVDRWGVDGEISPGESTWGEGGYGRVWLAEETAWALRRSARGCETVEKMAREGDLRFERAARELSLALSSDWAFLARTNGYAVRRWREHLDALDAIRAGVDEGPVIVGMDRRADSPPPWPTLTRSDFLTAEDEQ